jgi:hypothetical protein
MPYPSPDQPTGRLRRARAGGDVLFLATVEFSSAGPGVFARTSTATFTANIPDTIFVFAVGDDPSAATFDRTSTATFTEKL